MQGMGAAETNCTEMVAAVTSRELMTRSDQTADAAPRPSPCRLQKGRLYLSCWKACWTPPGPRVGPLVQDNPLLSLTNETEFTSEPRMGGRACAEEDEWESGRVQNGGGPGWGPARAWGSLAPP